jgi:hypothetical protein
MRTRNPYQLGRVRRITLDGPRRRGWSDKRESPDRHAAKVPRRPRAFGLSEGCARDHGGSVEIRGGGLRLAVAIPV